MNDPRASVMVGQDDDLGSVRSSIPGGLVFAVGAAVWISTAGFLFFVALPVMGLGAFLLVFAALVTKHSSTAARVTSSVLALVAVAAVVGAVWAPGY